MTTYVKHHQTRAADLRPVWHVIDAENKTLGRLSTEIAGLLQGKHRPMYVPYLNTGDFVVVVNAGKIRVTGNKLDTKMYYRHSGYHGGLKEQTLGQLLEKTPTRALRQAVKGMLPKNALGRKMLSRLKLYAETSHPHEAQVNAGRRSVKAEEAPKKGAKAGAARAKRATRKPRAKAEVEETPIRLATPRRTRAKAGASSKARRQTGVTPKPAAEEVSEGVQEPEEA